MSVIGLQTGLEDGGRMEGEEEEEGDTHWQALMADTVGLPLAIDRERMEGGGREGEGVGGREIERGGG